MLSGIFIEDENDYGSINVYKRDEKCATMGLLIVVKFILRSEFFIIYIDFNKLPWATTSWEKVLASFNILEQSNQF